LERGTLIGFTLGVIFVAASWIVLADQISDLVIVWNSAGIMITVGGSFAGAFFAVKFDIMMASLKAIKFVFKPQSLDPTAAIDKIVVLANTARKEGVLALEESADSMDDKFLKKGIMLIVDGTDPELVKGIMETELSYIDERHSSIAATFDYVASVAPAWGMVGTLVSLTLMLLQLDDPSTIGPKMAVAIITTFYGTMVANLFAGPVANKLKQTSKEEILLKTVLIEGMLSIQAGENPRIIEEKLKSFLSPSIRDNVGAESAGGGGVSEAEE
jgi:chemotaxis protein MotA